MNRRRFLTQLGTGALAAALIPDRNRAGTPAPQFGSRPGADSLARGWNTWNTRSALSHCLLPDGLFIDLSLWHYGMLASVKETGFGTTTLGASTGVKLAAAEVKSRRITVQAGPHAYDGSYTALTVLLGEVTIAIETAHDGEGGLVIGIGATAAKFKAPLLGVETGFRWNQPGWTEVLSANRIRGTAPGKTWEIHSTVPAGTEPNLVPGWAFPLTQRIGISVGPARPLAEIDRLLADARRRHETAQERYGRLGELHSAYQACLAWNTIYDARGRRLLTTSSRQWNTLRFGYGLFGWDSFFHGWLMVSDDPPLARNCVRQMLREMIGGQFVPNVVNGSGRRSADRSQPCVGALCVLAMHEIAPDLDYLREIWPALLTWNRWWHRARRNQRGLLSWGSAPFKPEVGDLAELMQPGTARGAAIESGLDNSPMYDAAPFDPKSHLLELSDVGLVSMYVTDCQALAAIAGLLGQTAAAAELESRGADYARRLQSLWNESAGIFQNRRTDTDAFDPRISPTSFYPLLAGAATVAQADAMIGGYLLNDRKFDGPWMLPSVPRDDPAFPDQLYLRGRIWAPLNFLVYLGLKRTRRDRPAAELADKSVRLFAKNWREQRGVFENYSAITGNGGDVPLCDPMCAWSGLLVLTGLIEEGRLPLPSILRSPTPS